MVSLTVLTLGGVDVVQAESMGLSADWFLSLTCLVQEGGREIERERVRLIYLYICGERVSEK